MKKFKKILLSLLIGAFLVGLSHSPALAIEPWDVSGNYDIDFNLTGDPTIYTHDASLAQTGPAVSGSGGYPSVGPQTYSWVITSGSVSGNSITLTMDYTLGAIGTTMNMIGIIAPDGSMSGTWSDNLGGGTRTGDWSTSAGNAFLLIPFECQGMTFDNVIIGTNGANTLNGTAGRDLIVGKGGNDKINGLGGNDCLAGNSGADTINGSSGNDRMLGGDQADVMNGDSGDDRLYGGNQNDVMSGGSGNDILDGQAGANNNLNGNSGTDTCTNGATLTSCEL